MNTPHQFGVSGHRVHRQIGLMKSRG